MRIKVVQKRSVSVVDGISLDVYQPGVRYEMGNCLGALFPAEGWAVPVNSIEPAMQIPLRSRTRSS
jgi:hypothetical protein